MRIGIRGHDLGKNTPAKFAQSAVDAKDFILADGELVQVSPGKGDIDYPYLIEKLKTLQTTPDIILEDVTGDDIEFSRAFLAEML